MDEESQENNQTAAAEKGKFNYIYVESPYLETPAEENVVVSWGDGSENISSMTLVCVKADGTQSEWTNIEREENLFLFNKAFSNEESGTYQFTGLKFIQDEIEYVLDLEELQIKAEFGVNEEYEGYEPYPEDVSDIPLDEVEASVVVLDNENIGNAEEEIETTLEDVSEMAEGAAMARSAAPMSKAAARSNGTVVVALDPGHGGTDPGASNASYGAKEKDLCLKIAQYAKEELDQYNGVKVVMTRNSDVTLSSLQERVNIAKNQGANLFVSIHLNAANGNAYGAEVYYPNDNLNASIGAQGEQAASKILSEITKLGLTNRGIKIRNTVHDKYSDGSLQDYYGIIRYSKLAGFPGIIVEHAFIDNNSDYEKYLNTDAKLKKLGIADATGIANYLGLSKGSGIWVKDLDEFAGTAVIQASGLGSNGKVTIKNTTTGASKTHTLSEGKGTININIKDYKGGGNYTATGANYNVSFYMSTDPSCKISYTEVSKEKQYKLSAVFPDMPKAVQKVQFAVWSGGQQEDLQWYNGDQSKSGKQVTWTAAADIAKHKRAGDYNVHVYALLEDGSQRFLGATGFKVSAPTLKVAVTGKNQDAGTFDLKASDVKSASGVSKIRAAVWCAENQSDIKWYDMSKKSDGSYTAKVSMANHKYAVGTYKVHVYITAGNGIEAFGGGLSQSISLPNIKISASDKDGKETTYNLKASNLNFLGALKGVRFGVWSEAGGQDDLKWYNGTRNSSGDWTASADIRNHKTAGKYHVHAYATQANGDLIFIGGANFRISTPTGTSARVTEYDNEYGSFKVVISGVKSASGVSKIQVPVWSQANQNDIKWYDAKRQSDGSYVANVDPMYHNYNSGNYNIHIYAISGNGVSSCVGIMTQTVKATQRYTIMGDTTVTVDQMVRYYERYSSIGYPSKDLGAGGAPDLRTFCQMYYDEAAMEGVRAEVAFAQAMKETGWLKYGGIVNIGQFNFAGIGALDGNSNGNCASFPDVRTGIRAQIQHLKAYGSTAALNNPKVDPRFDKVTRGAARYVEWLGQKENPTGAGWATGKNYGLDIVAMIKVLKSM